VIFEAKLTPKPVVLKAKEVKARPVPFKVKAKATK